MLGNGVYNQDSRPDHGLGRQYDGENVMSEYLRVCEQAARAAGEVLLDWQGRFGVREKGPADLVTEADLAAQNTIREILLGAFPDHRFLGEEDTSEDGDAGDESLFRWIVDPLDGTTNYVHGIPIFSVSVALEKAGEILVATVLNPVSGECFTAQAGQGAYLGDKPMRASETTRIEDALVAASFPPRTAPDSLDVARFVAVLPYCRAVRRLGSAALNLCYVAAGRLDAYWASNAKTWDVAAGLLLIREAGGIVTAIDGGPLNLAHPLLAAASTESLHEQFVALLPRSGE